jgi:hypothetical protein
MRESLERLLATVSDQDLETLRDAILREEGRRRTMFRLDVKMPFPPLTAPDERESTVTRWARLLAWMAHDLGIPIAEGQRGVTVRLVLTEPLADLESTAILLQDALVEAGLLLGRMPEWMTAARIEAESGEKRLRIDRGIAPCLSPAALG